MTTAVIGLFVAFAAMISLFVAFSGLRLRGAIGVRRRILAGVADALGPVPDTVDWARVDRLLGDHEWLNHHYEEYREQCWEVNGTVFNGEQAGSYFSEDHLRPPEWGWLDITPGTLTGLGIFGTFAGILYGLWGFSIAEDIDVMNGQVNGLIDGLSVSFLSSIVGLGLSIVATGMQRNADGAFDVQRRRLVRWLDRATQRGVTRAALDDLEARMRTMHDQWAIVSKGQTEVFQAMRESLTVIADEAKTHTAELQHLQHNMLDAVEKGIQASGLISSVQGMSDTISASQSEGVGEMVDGFLSQMNDNFGESFEGLGTSIDTMVGANQQYQSSMAGLVDQLARGTEHQMQASAQAQQTVEAAGRAVEEVQSILKTLGTSASEIHAAGKAVENALTAQREVIDDQRTLNAEVVDAVKLQSDGWGAHQDAVVEAYGRIEGKYGGLQDALESLVTWHDRVKDGLNRQVQTWADAVGAQQALTTTVGEERQAWGGLVSELQGAATRFGELGEGLQKVAGMLEAQVGDLEAAAGTARSQQDSGHAQMVALAGKLGEVGDSLGGSWQEYAQVASALSDSLPDVTALLAGLTQAVDMQRAMVGETRGLADAISSTADGQRALSTSVSGLLETAEATRASMQPAAEALGNSADALHTAVRDFGETRTSLADMSAQTARAAEALERRDATAAQQWASVQEALAAASTQMVSTMERYQMEVNKTVDTTFRDFDRELADAVSSINGAISALHTMVEGLEAIADELAEGK